MHARSRRLDELLYNGKAHAELSRGLELAKQYAVNVSPTFVFNEGRQRLTGSVGIASSKPT